MSQSRATEIMEGFRERVTGATTNINSDHKYIHEGIAFKAYLDIGTLTENEQYALKTPEKKYTHFKNLSLVALGGTVKVTIKRGTEDNELRIDSEGNEPGENNFDELVGPNNLNDYSGEDTGVSITEGPTYDTEGEGDGEGESWHIIQVVGDSTNQFTSVAETQTNPNEEFVLKPDTYYIIDVEKASDSPTHVLLTLFWYEEDSA